MLQVQILASGSAGNSALIRSNGTAVLIDAGLSAKQLCQRLALCNLDVGDLSGIVLTHEHGDHTRALKVLCSKARIPVYANRMTAAAVENSGTGGAFLWNYFTNGNEFRIGDLTLDGFTVPHDAVDPVGFLIRNSSHTFGLLTDVGYVTQLVTERMREADFLLVETNYDDELLQRDEKRPWSVKQRITSRHGHLSNLAASELVRNLAGSRLKHVLIGHLSRDCNRPDLAISAMRTALDGCGCAATGVFCATQDNVSPVFTA